MLEVLKYIFSEWYIFIGFIVLIGIIGDTIKEIASVFVKNKAEETTVILKGYQPTKQSKNVPEPPKGGSCAQKY